MKSTPQYSFEGCGAPTIMPMRPSPAMQTTVLICDSLAEVAYGFDELHIEVRVPLDPIQGPRQLQNLMERHSPELVVFTRASFARLMGYDDEGEASSLNQVSENRPTLSAVNAEIVGLVAKGLKNPEIERATGMKRRTIRARLSELYRQFEVTNRTELVGTLIERGAAIPRRLAPNRRANTTSASAEGSSRGSRRAGATATPTPAIGERK